MILWNRSPGLGIAEDWFSTAQYFDIKTRPRGLRGARDRDRRQLQPHRRRRARARRHDPRVVEPLPLFGARAAHGRLLEPTRTRCPARGGRAVLAHADLPAPLRRRSGRRRPHAGPERRAVRDRRRAAAGLRRPARGDADARRGGARRGGRAAAARRGRARKRATARTTTSSASCGRASLPRRRRPSWTRSPPACAATIPAFYPPNGGLTFSVVPLHEQVVGNVRQALLRAGRRGRARAADRGRERREPAAARASARQREVAVRAALGASARAARPRAARREPAARARRGSAWASSSAARGRARAGALGAASVPRIGEIRVGPEVLLFTLARLGRCRACSSAWRRPGGSRVPSSPRRSRRAATARPPQGGVFSRPRRAAASAGRRGARARGRAAGGARACWCAASRASRSVPPGFDPRTC